MFAPFDLLLLHTAGISLLSCMDKELDIENGVERYEKAKGESNKTQNIVLNRAVHTTNPSQLFVLTPFLINN